MYFSVDFPSTDFHESCGRLKTDSTYSNDTTPGYNGDCNGENFTLMCVLIDIFSVIIIIVNCAVLVAGVIAIRRQMVQANRICEFYLILNLAFSDFITGILSLLIDAWDYINEVCT